MLLRRFFCRKKNGKLLCSHKHNKNFPRQTEEIKRVCLPCPPVAALCTRGNDLRNSRLKIARVRMTDVLVTCQQWPRKRTHIKCRRRTQKASEEVVCRLMLVHERQGEGRGEGGGGLRLTDNRTKVRANVFSGAYHGLQL